MFSIIIGIIGVGQYNLDTDQDIMVEDYPSYEYDKLKFIREDGDSGGLVIARRGAHFLVNFLFVLRYSLGDYGEFFQSFLQCSHRRERLHFDLCRNLLRSYLLEQSLNQ